MKSTITKSIDLASGVLVMTLIFWIIETVFFLIRDGWHWYATCQAEKVCDFIVASGIVYAFIMYMYAALYAARLIAKLLEKSGK
jgi:phosphate starvation-inducible membrane PsiE